MFRPLLLLGLAALAQAAVLSIQSPRAVVTSSDGSQLRSEQIDVNKKAAPWTLGGKDKLKLTFQVTTDEGNGVQPHQAFLRFLDEATGEEGIQPIRVSAGGKAKFELNMAKPPSSLPPTTSSPLKVSLLLGSFEHDPARYELLDLVLPASQPAPQHADEATFSLLPEIAHTFRPDQKLPPKAISAAFSALVTAPWLALFFLWSKSGIKAPHLFAPQVLPFTSLLAAFEGLLLWYWVDLRLGDVLLYATILTPFTAYAGKIALVAASEWRLGRK